MLKDVVAHVRSRWERKETRQCGALNVISVSWSLGERHFAPRHCSGADFLLLLFARRRESPRGPDTPNALHVYTSGQAFTTNSLLHADLASGGTCANDLMAGWMVWLPLDPGQLEEKTSICIKEAAGDQIITCG